MRDIGVVMPVYNQDPNYLQMALRSILGQSYIHFTLVIVLDGVSQATEEQVKKITRTDPRVEIFMKEKNEGVAKALNFGFCQLMKRLEIKYFTWVSSDNIYYPQFLETLHEALTCADSETGLVFSSFRHIDGKGAPKKDLLLEHFRKYQNQPKENLLDVCFIGVSFMYKKEVASQIDGYRMEPVEDYDYWLRLTEHCEIKYVPHELMDYRENSPFSVSAQLRGSTQQHRRWRYALNSAKDQARKRRGIPVETTILYTIHDGSTETVAGLENLLDQSYSNYKLLIADLSRGGEAYKRITSVLSDPHFERIPLYEKNERQAIKTALQTVNTPYSLVSSNRHLLSEVFILYQMVLVMRTRGDHPVVSFDSGSGNAGVCKVEDSGSFVYNQLYRTQDLKHLLGIL